MVDMGDCMVDMGDCMVDMGDCMVDMKDMDMRREMADDLEWVDTVKSWLVIMVLAIYNIQDTMAMTMYEPYF